MFGRLAGCLELHLLNLLLSKSLIAEDWLAELGGHWHHGRLLHHALVYHVHDLLLRDVAGERVLHFEKVWVELIIFFPSWGRHLCWLDVLLLFLFALEKVILALETIPAFADWHRKGVAAKRNLL